MEFTCSKCGRHDVKLVEEIMAYRHTSVFINKEDGSILLDDELDIRVGGKPRDKWYVCSHCGELVINIKENIY